MSDAVAIALITMIGTVLTSFMSLIILVTARRTHDLVNGVTHELINSERGRATAEGITVGEQAQRDRTTGGES